MTAAGGGATPHPGGAPGSPPLIYRALCKANPYPRCCEVCEVMTLCNMGWLLTVAVRKGI